MAATSEILPDHVLAAVLTLAKRQRNKERLAFRSYDFQLQEIFYGLSQKYPILSAYVFTDIGPEPYSPALNESVARLQLSGLIGRENPNYEVVFLQGAADKFYDEVLAKEFSGPQLNELGQIASEFVKLVDVV